MGSVEMRSQTAFLGPRHATVGFRVTLTSIVTVGAVVLGKSGMEL